MIYAGKCKTLMLSSVYQREGFVRLYTFLFSALRVTGLISPQL